MRIGEVAAAAGVSVDAIRFYERGGLLPAAQRTESGYRVYPAGTVERLRVIRRLQTLGMPLAQIRDLTAVAAGEPGCGAIRERLLEQRRQLRARIGALHALEAELARTLAACNRNLRRPGGAACPAVRGQKTP